ncbi:MAG TPA: hypothetical protein PLK16_07830 [Saprospiraceae bacterium]|nr:hypothetical protein [Saprospiraceae bacterium]HNJ17104.1 hypothetical protein [Saprospiraceae bacterium]HNJ63215.1 hypothetical protein [Saprospiraceae bacterium]
MSGCGFGRCFRDGVWLLYVCSSEEYIWLTALQADAQPVALAEVNERALEAVLNALALAKIN